MLCWVLYLWNSHRWPRGRLPPAREPNPTQPCSVCAPSAPALPLIPQDVSGPARARQLGSHLCSASGSQAGGAGGRCLQSGEPSGCTGNQRHGEETVEGGCLARTTRASQERPRHQLVFNRNDGKAGLDGRVCVSAGIQILLPTVQPAASPSPYMPYTCLKHALSTQNLCR